MEDDVENRSAVADETITEPDQIGVVSERKLRANRENAKKFTGPRTARGKAYSRQNAIKHGLFTRAPIEFLLLRENPRDYDALLNDLREQYQPIGRAEVLEVERMAQSWWRLKRASRFEMATIRVAVRDLGRKELARQEEHSEQRDEKDEALIVALRSMQEEIETSEEAPEDFKQKIFALRPEFESLWPRLEE
jgi:hypothetical protein